MFNRRINMAHCRKFVKMQQKCCTKRQQNRIFAMQIFHKRQIIFYKNYFEDFLNFQSIEVKKKILWTLKIIENETRIHSEYLKHLHSTKGIYEIRIQHLNNQYHILCFFSTNNRIVILNCFQKKSQKTPKNEIKKANKIKQEYEQEYQNIR